MAGVQPRIYGGLIVDAATHEEFGLVSIGGHCSGCLLRNNWVITAAHCVETSDPPVRDPNRAGQNLIVNPASLVVSADWGGSRLPDGRLTGQSSAAAWIETFRPYDIAIIRLQDPIQVFGSTTSFDRLIFQDGQFPYFGQRVPVLMNYFGRGQSTTTGPNDHKYRVAWGKTHRESAYLYWWPAEEGRFGVQFAYKGDSGGPSFAWVLGGYALMGVHSLLRISAEGIQNADAPIEPVWDAISRHIGPPPPRPTVPRLEPVPGYVGVFAQTPADFDPAWVYAVQQDGVLLWYRKDRPASGWQGPRQVGYGWASFADIIPGGGNQYFAVTNGGDLWWYQHHGFNDGSYSWDGPRPVGTGWQFQKIFGGSDGVIYAIRSDGVLLWYRFGGFRFGTAEPVWQGPQQIGTGWHTFKDVLSTGRGTIYAIDPDGELWLYEHLGHLTGAADWNRWQRPGGIGHLDRRKVGVGWQGFRQVLPVGDGRMLALTADGRLLAYKHKGFEIVHARPPLGTDKYEEKWDGPIEISSGWDAYARIFAALPSRISPVN